MKVTVNGYEVDITARRVIDSTENEAATMAVLQEIMLWAWDSAKSYKQQGCPALECLARKAGDAIFDTLDDAGYYKDTTLDF